MEAVVEGDGWEIGETWGRGPEEEEAEDAVRVSWFAYRDWEDVGLWKSYKNIIKKSPARIRRVVFAHPANRPIFTESQASSIVISLGEEAMVVIWPIRSAARKNGRCSDGSKLQRSSYEVLASGLGSPMFVPSDQGLIFGPIDCAGCR